MLIGKMKRLILRRKFGETVVIHRGGEVLARVTPERLSGARVVLSLEGPEDVRIDRLEVLKAIGGGDDDETARLHGPDVPDPRRAPRRRGDVDDRADADRGPVGPRV